jgi:DNA-binding CsgD family transcriptional regulator
MVRGRALTPRQLDAVRALLATGNPKAAAYTMGISPLTFRNLIADARIRAGVESNEQLVYRLSKRGDLRSAKAV